MLELEIKKIVKVFLYQYTLMLHVLFQHKCECYWVNTTNEERQFGNVTVSFVKARQVCPDFMVRTLKIKYPTDSGKTGDIRF